MSQKSYQFLNTIYRALDSFNCSNDYSITEQIHGIRVLLENHSFRNECRYIPDRNILQARLQTLHARTFGQNVHEINDIYINMNFGIVDNAYADFRNTEKVNNTTTLASIAEDAHNVHNSAINNSVKQVAINLVNDYPVHGDLIKSIIAKLRTRKSWNAKAMDTLRFIAKSKVHFNINITLKQMLLSLFVWINTHRGEEREELLNRLIEELIDMNGYCSTGHMSRIVNVPQGYTDNQRYIIGINVEEELGKSVRNMLTSSLKDASEEVIDGIMDRTDAYIKYIDSVTEKLMDEWIRAYGKDNIENIQTVINEFKN